MPNFNPDTLKRGKEAIREAVENGGGGDFRPFLSQIYWPGDKDEHYILILNPLEEIPRLEFHPFIGIEDQKFPEQVIARTDPSIGERVDPISDTWKYEPKLTNLMIAVELEPVFEQRGKYEKAVGFSVKTREFQRTVKDDEGEPTDEKEDVVAPMVGYIAQSPFNFSNSLETIDTSDGPIQSMALKVTRIGAKTNVNYQFKTFEEIPIDLTDLLDHIHDVAYVGDDLDIEGMDDDEALEAIGHYLLYKKLNELADPENYDDVFNRITQPARFQKDKKQKDDKPVERAARPSQRQRREQPVEETPEEEPKEEVTKASTPRARVEHLKAKARGEK